MITPQYLFMHFGIGVIIIFHGKLSFLIYVLVSDWHAGADIGDLHFQLVGIFNL